MIMRMAPVPSIGEGKLVHQELRDLLETTAVQQAQSSAERRHPEASLVHITSTCGAPEGHHEPSELRPGDGGVACRGNPPQCAATTSETTMPEYPRAPSGLGETKQAKINYTMVTVTRTITTNILGYGTLNVA